MALTVFSAIVDWVLFPKLSLQAKRLFFLILCYQTSSAPLQLLHSSLLSHFISVRCSQRGNRLASDDLTQGSTRSGRLLASPLYRWGLIERRLSVQIILLWVIVQVPSFINKRQMTSVLKWENNELAEKIVNSCLSSPTLEETKRGGWKRETMF